MSVRLWLSVSDCMKIELTREQYRNLLGYLVVAGSVLGPLADFGGGSREESEAAQSLEDYVAQHAPMFDSLDMVHNHEGLLHVDDAVLEKVMDEVTSEYDEMIFWTELEDRLVERELAKLDGEIDDLESVEHQLRKDFVEEFEQNGIDNLRLG